jgi:hypothetical protein
MRSGMFASTLDVHWLQFAGVIIWIYGFMQLMVMPALQFFTRYLIIVWNIQLKTHLLLLLLLAFYSIPISYSVLCYISCSDDTFYQQIAFETFEKNVMTIVNDNGTVERRFVVACDIVSNAQKYTFL